MTQLAQTVLPNVSKSTNKGQERTCCCKTMPFAMWSQEFLEDWSVPLWISCLNAKMLLYLRTSACFIGFPSYMSYNLVTDYQLLTPVLPTVIKLIHIATYLQYLKIISSNMTPKLPICYTL